jgi:sugar/nucleoside kinase (ribokinase family)
MSRSKRSKAVVLGNVTLDVLCSPVDDVPRHDSIPFEQVAISPGGCGSNVAVGLCALGVPAVLVSCIGSDDAAGLVERTWRRAGVDTRFVRRVEDLPTAVSVGLVDSDAQPRFIHIPGANAALTTDMLDLPALTAEGSRFLHVAGFLVMPGLEGKQLAKKLAAARQRGMITTLDVILSRTRDDPAPLWPCLPHLDVFLCNWKEAHHLTGEEEPLAAAGALRRLGARAVVVKLGAGGCWLEHEEGGIHIPAPPIEVVDTTGAGDAFAAGLIAGLLRGDGLEGACRSGHAAAARVVGALGTVTGWFERGDI